MTLEEAKELRKRRKRMGLTQHQLAAKLGISHMPISKIEGGDLNVRYDILKSIVEYLGFKMKIQYGKVPTNQD